MQDPLYGEQEVEPSYKFAKCGGGIATTDIADYEPQYHRLDYHALGRGDRLAGRSGMRCFRCPRSRPPMTGFSTTGWQLIRN